MKTSSCIWIKKHLVPLCEKTLPPELQSEVRIHLSECPRCEMLAQDFSVLWNDLASQKQPGRQIDLWPSLEFAIKDQTGSAQQARGFFQKIPAMLRPAVAALALVLAIGAGWELGNPPQVSGVDTRFGLSGSTSFEEMYISEYLEPFSDAPVGSFAAIYLDSGSPDKDTPQ